ncbi:MAG: anti-sigma factor antagonist [Calditrichaeota bacterium]|nr:MAG: anti-sigma factor antagonist [Calditrichota bacterium]
MEGIQVSVERTGANRNIAVIKVGGYIDTTTSAELEHSLNTLIKANTYKIIIDLGNVDYISSAGWGIFISEIKGIREKGGDLKLIRMIPDVFEVFELLEFHYIIKSFDTLEEAINDFEDGGESARPAAYKDSSESHTEASTATMAKGNKDLQADQAHYQNTKTNALSSTDYVIRAATENPMAGTLKLKKMLNSSKYGNVRIGYFQLRKVLKQNNLDSKNKRVEYQSTN